RRSNQADTHDLGVINMPTVEPGLFDSYVFDYAIAGDGKFDDVKAWQMGANLNVPLIGEYINALPSSLSYGFFTVNQPNVQIVDVKTLSDSTIHGEVSAAPLNPQTNKIYTIRLQEFAGKATTAQIVLPVKIKSAALVNLTEDVVLQNVVKTAPLTVDLKPFETATVKVEIE
ncbi:MAG: glycosyl hydrolase-related protein, partial [Acidobacteriota bacterium]